LLRVRWGVAASLERALEPCGGRALLGLELDPVRGEPNEALLTDQRTVAAQAIDDCAKELRRHGIGQLAAEELHVHPRTQRVAASSERTRSSNSSTALSPARWRGANGWMTMPPPSVRSALSLLKMKRSPRKATTGASQASWAKAFPLGASSVRPPSSTSLPIT